MNDCEFSWRRAGAQGRPRTRFAGAPYLRFNQAIVPGLPSWFVENRHYLPRVTAMGRSFCEGYYVSNGIGCTNLHRDSSARSLMHMPVDEL